MEPTSHLVCTSAQIKVHNDLGKGVSMHWHGIQPINPWMDGARGVTQCDIAPGETFTYRFTPGEHAGTFWYHAHSAALRDDGLFGPLIVHAPLPRDGDAKKEV
jgi:FtsP/CotA-like multicopper oxidase with cupredoxin domain